MKILSMTATFGKLQNQTLTLKPGLNIIHAPNEWGKSTWCAFLVTMLYGLPRRERNTKDALSDKEHYAPWSGSPMSGSMDIEWNGRSITIQRRSKGRSPMSEFYAFETDTGLEVKELTADNCGEMLLGVERSVFTRAGFLRFSDLSVEQDEALRSRLNALVTTGDESNTSQVLGQKLKELKSKCSGRSGILPQVKAQQQQLQRKLDQQQGLLEQIHRLRERQKDLEDWANKLENHKAALVYASAKSDSLRVAQAVNARDAARDRLTEQENQCAHLPSRETIQEALDTVTTLRQEWESLQMEQQMLPPAPSAPETPASFSGIAPEDAVAQAQRDSALAQNFAVPPKNAGLLLLIIGSIATAAGIALAIFIHLVAGIICSCIGTGLLVTGLLLTAKNLKTVRHMQQQRDALIQRYGTDDPNAWVASAHSFVRAWEDYGVALNDYISLRGDMDQRGELIAGKIAAEGGNLAAKASFWQEMLSQWDALNDARRDYQQLDSHAAALQAMVRTVPAPKHPDTMEYTEAETNRLLADAAYERRQLDLRLGQFQGQIETFGNREQLESDLRTVSERLSRLEQTNAALDVAQETLNQAAAQLQRRFAPRITQQAQALFSRLTHGRYGRLTLGEDLSMQASAEGEDTLRNAQWRSDGTVDQLYLALRLAVAHELTPKSPLVLDDALIRFDDVRLHAALEILKEESAGRQVLIFTCQNREATALRSMNPV